MTDAIERNEKGQVVPGAGGALGATSTRRLGTSQISKIKALVEPERHAIIANLVKIAKSDSKDAVRAGDVLLGFLAAKPKPQSELVRIEALAQADTLQAKCDAVVLAVARGEASAEAGRALLAMLDVYARAKRVDELEARIRALEGRAPHTFDAEPGSDLV